MYIVLHHPKTTAWINKMTVMTTKMWEKENLLDNPDVKELIEDIRLKHYGT